MSCHRAPFDRRNIRIGHDVLTCRRVGQSRHLRNGTVSTIAENRVSTRSHQADTRIYKTPRRVPGIRRRRGRRRRIRGVGRRRQPNIRIPQVRVPVRSTESRVYRAHARQASVRNVLWIQVNVCEIAERQARPAHHVLRLQGVQLEAGRLKTFSIRI